MQGLFIIMLIIGVAVAVLRGVAKQNEKTGNAWRVAAQDLGLEYWDGGFFGKRSITGRLQGYRVAVEIAQRHQNAQQTVYHVVFPQSLGLGLEIKEEGVVASLAKMLGDQDIEVGDPAFDRLAIVKGRDPERVRQLLEPSVRGLILDLFGSAGKILVSDTEVRCQTRGVEKEFASIVSRVQQLKHIASRLSAAQAAAPMVEAPVVETPPSLFDAVPLPTAPPPEVAPVTEVVEPVIVAERTQPAVVDPIAPVAVAELPDIELPSTPEPTTEIAAVESPSPVLHEVCAQLFDPAVLSLEAGKRFDERYRDAHVRWSGKLRQVEHYGFDLVFGSQPGTRAIIELPAVAHRAVQAVLQLPPGVERELAQRVGEEVTFEGPLTSCNAFQRKLFITAARLI